MKPREITLVSRDGRTVRLHVPEAYIYKAGGREMIENAAQGRPGGSVEILAFLPDMLPKHLAEPAERKVFGPGIESSFTTSENALLIDVIPADPVNWVRFLERTKERYTYDRDADGFAVYYQIIRAPDDGTKPWRSTEFLIPLGSEDAIIECGLSQSGRRLRCNVRVPQQDSVRLELLISSSYLSEWREIWSKARALVATFVQHHTLAPRVTRSSSSCSNVSPIASAAPVPAASRASFEG